MEIFIKDLILKHKNQPCVVVGAGHEMFNFDYKNFKNSEYLHNNVFYVGLHSKVKKQNIIKLAAYLNDL